MDGKLPPHNSYWVVPGKLLAGEYPRHLDEQESLGRLRQFTQANVSFFVDLTEPGELKPYEHLLPQVTDKPCFHRRFAIPDGKIPHSKTQMMEILDAIDVALASEHTVYVHCWGGIGRTGTVIGCWFARHQEPGLAALAQLRAFWSHCAKSKFRASPEYPWQEEFVINWREIR